MNLLNILLRHWNILIGKVIGLFARANWIAQMMMQAGIDDLI